MAIEKGFYRAGDLYAAGLVYHTQFHGILPTGRHFNFALHFKTFNNFWLNQKAFVCVLVLQSRIPSNGHRHFDITYFVMQQRALSVFKKGAPLRFWSFDCAGIFGSKLHLLQPSVASCICFRGKFSVNIKINDFVGNVLQSKFYACCYILWIAYKCYRFCSMQIYLISLVTFA